MGRYVQLQTVRESSPSSKAAQTSHSATLDFVGARTAIGSGHHRCAAVFRRRCTGWRSVRISGCKAPEEVLLLQRSYMLAPRPTASLAPYLNLSG